MAETASNADSSQQKLGAPKDKNCPYCGQAFTSSSLGRHLDLYIKEKNPKPPDGIHDVDAIKRLRGSITRRQPRGSLGGRNASTPATTPRPTAKRDAAPDSGDSHKSPALPKDGQYAVDSTLSKYPWTPSWEATGVMNNIPAKNGEVGTSTDGEGSQNAGKRPRQVSKQVIQKAQFDVKHKLADAMDTARAAELALRELLSSWRAAKQQIDNNSMPFDFDPLALDFPALTLQCLASPPTLFSSTQHPTSTSWSVQSPGQREYDALKAFFQEEFSNWKITCATATTAAMEDLTYPPRDQPVRDTREAVKKAEKSAENLEKQVNEHLASAFQVWSSLPIQRRNELWLLEMARSVGRKQTEIDKMKDDQHRLQQENANLKSQIDQLNRLQQPREFKLFSPATVPLERQLLTHVLEAGIKSGSRHVGLRLEDRQLDLNDVVVRAIERWKTVISMNRVANTGMNAQRALDQANNSTPTPTPTPQQQQQQQQQQQNQQGQQQQPQQHQQMQAAQQQQQMQQQQVQQFPSPEHRQSTTSATGHSDPGDSTGPPSIDEASDQDADADGDADADADAEMEDDDSFAVMNTPTAKPMPQQPIQRQATLEVPRTRQVQQRGASDARFMMQNGNPNGNRQAINMSRSMPNMQATMQSMHGGDMGLAMSQVRGDPMYMD
ncbi:hypothetical protein HER10_EVM0006574 [Colletotrichum scovillei]|uniref:Uncharacterized protein n=1 Tax=Colletotrichum scovillei TaxID=1209932 RepID=A0A9P7R3C5_9PEZI|nr:uncharacterized protein HER10_EVM0006574 [Colletotrichum scovillei]KAF4776493.1 hypothetical protein HER10_EVM0006574 [Colletotrichum scovillei]KAG7047459.1 hypothetical protein JMJ77_0010811 [Colletotrichum scovillei]KAG7059776.1 hypothetical protein JMJ78_0015065 [Colletotrichum scovillei]KAG7067224.1 hypothetical protein JMJ76_0008667 [Colletotrichum scovillei]